MSKPVTRILVASLLALATASSVYAAEKAHTEKAHTEKHDKSAAAQYVDDASITANIKARHAEDKSVRVTAIGVETKNGVVQLSGFTPSNTEKVRAEEIARTVPGVKSVKNDIIVRAN